MMNKNFKIVGIMALVVFFILSIFTGCNASEISEKQFYDAKITAEDDNRANKLEPFKNALREAVTAANKGGTVIDHYIKSTGNKAWYHVLIKNEEKTHYKKYTIKDCEVLNECIFGEKNLTTAPNYKVENGVIVIWNEEFYKEKNSFISAEAKESPLLSSYKKACNEAFEVKYGETIKDSFIKIMNNKVYYKGLCNDSTIEEYVIEGNFSEVYECNESQIYTNYFSGYKVEKEGYIYKGKIDIIHYGMMKESE